MHHNINQVRLNGYPQRRFIDSSDEYKNVLLVEGARQVGKTALIEHAIERSDKRSCSANLEKDTLLRALIDD